jgi:hypothetical protein
MGVCRTGCALRLVPAAHRRASHHAPRLGGRDAQPWRLPARQRSPGELYQWVRREEQYATVGANVVVELYSESHARKPTTRAWGIIRRADRSHRLAGQRTSRADRGPTDRAGRSDRTNPRSGRRPRMFDDQLTPTSSTTNRRSARPRGSSVPGPSWIPCGPAAGGP